MTSRELILEILIRIKKFSLLIVLGGLVAGILLFLYARSVPVVYSVRSTVFPLSSPQENNSASSKISELLGASNNNSRSISDEANVNIEEVAKSRKTSEAVVSQPIAAYGNKILAEILIKEYNKNRGFMTPEIKLPLTEPEMISAASTLFQNEYTVKFNKNNLLEIVFSSTDEKLLEPVSYILIDKLSGFYKELKIEKAKADFDFIQAKVDSFQQVLNSYDKQQIVMNNTTMFVPSAKLEYSIPKENIQNDKLRVMGQHNGAAAEREDALWRLQKATPIIQVLDKPEPPFTKTKASAALYVVGGFVLGCFLIALACISGLLYRYAGGEVQNYLSDKTVSPENTSTTA